ncbi:hypothetical protein E2C01_080406 [Portunus trituberculatus]|uniref:Uncharacterized protein n=1 Tax=Portunus trituberculatus TaxID=210409 RepID=A0A5B7IT68_PORTR|nr:hypothetical protein [Portunus trituberculatus]
MVVEENEAGASCVKVVVVVSAAVTAWGGRHINVVRKGAQGKEEEKNEHRNTRIGRTGNKSP